MRYHHLQTCGNSGYNIINGKSSSFVESMIPQTSQEAFEQKLSKYYSQFKLNPHQNWWLYRLYLYFCDDDYYNDNHNNNSDKINMASKIKAAIRVRPFLPTELKNGYKNNRLQVSHSKKEIQVLEDNTKRSFHFDYLFS